jgi:adenylate cyclase
MLIESLTPGAPLGRPVQIVYHEYDDSIFADGVYLIKGLAGRILWLVLTVYMATGRSMFSNRELRLHPFLKLSPWKSNLEARLLLLQRRLDKKAAAFRLSRERRGQVDLLCAVQLELNLAKMQPQL